MAAPLSDPAATAEAVVGPTSGLIAPHRPAAWLWTDGTRRRGVIEHLGNGRWAFVPRDPQDAAALATARRTGLTLAADERLRRRLRLAPLPLGGIVVEEHRVILHTLAPEAAGARLYPTMAAIPATVSGASLFDRRLPAAITRLSPYEVVLAIEDEERFATPAAIVTIALTRPWSGRFEILARVCAVQEQPAGTMLHLRALDHRSVDDLARLAVCECEDFGPHALWTLGLAMPDLRGALATRHVRSDAEMRAVLALRRSANQFFGRRPTASEATDWGDRFDASSVEIVVRAGSKVVAAARLVINAGRQGLSEIDQAVRAAGFPGLPDFLWADGFVEISRLVIHPEFRGIDIRVSLFREIGRLAVVLGCRYMVFDSIPKLLPIYEKIGGVRLPFTKRHQDSDEMEHVLYVDVRRSLTALDRRLPYWLFVFGRTLNQCIAVYGEDSVRRFLGGRAGIDFGVKKLLARAVARLVD